MAVAHLARAAPALLLALLVAGCAAPAASSHAPTTAAPPTVQNPMVLFGQSYTWPGGPTVLLLQPRPETSTAAAPGMEVVSLRMKVTAGATPLVPRSDLQIALTAGGQPTTGLRNDRMPGLTADPIPAGDNRILTLGFQAPAGSTGWQATVTFRGAPPVVTYQQDI